MKLTKQNIDRLTLAPGQSELIKSSDDVPGLRFRVRSNGSRSWEFKFGKLPRMSLGKYPAVSVEKAPDGEGALRQDNPRHQMSRQRFALPMSAETKC